MCSIHGTPDAAWGERFSLRGRFNQSLTGYLGKLPPGVALVDGLLNQARARPQDPELLRRSVTRLFGGMAAGIGGGTGCVR